MEAAFGPASTRSVSQIRGVIRSARWRAHTSGLAPNHVQCNLVILPASHADDFAAYCQNNPRACPLLYQGQPGVRALGELGRDLDVCTDVPRYRVFRHGELTQEVDDIVAHWRDDLVPFLLGCSFSFEAALLKAGIPLRHLAQGKNVAMYKTNIETTPAGEFRGPLVVSMRPMRAADAARAAEICARYPRVHGAPLHVGDPHALGIADLQRPDFGDAVELAPDELPVYWACGVTPQAAVEAARPELCLTHAPGCMLITDLTNDQLASA
ncbi:MAG: putative hydro-lyase [Polyangiales bacterium]